MTKTTIIFSVVLCMLFSVCSGCVDSTINSNESSEESNLSSHSLMYAYSAEDYDIADANNAFAFDVYSNINNNANVFFSPYSIFTAMAICYDGAEEETQEEISYVFYYPLKKDVLEESSGEMIETINSENDEYTLNTANALWVRENYPLNVDFVHNSKKYYGGNVTNINFYDEEQSRTTINQWVASKTNDMIKDLIPVGMITPDTALIITNAIYFKGKWLYEFDVENTQEELFYNSSSAEGTPVEMMYTTEYFGYGEDENAKIVELPYKGDNLCMYVVLPVENKIEEFEAEFSLSDYNGLKSSIEPQVLVHTWLPKFKFDSKFKLSDTLKSMGIKTAFTGSSNLSGIYDIEKVPDDYVLMIDDVVHQAYIDVQEEGTEAAAATAIECVDSAEPSDLKIAEFKADHPFMFFIEDKRTDCILFMGKVENPDTGNN